MHYSWAARYAQVHGGCTPERLATAFRIPQPVAAELFGKLQADGILAAPGFSGIARAVNPVNWSDLQFSRPAAPTPGALARRLRRALEERGTESETGTPEPDERPDEIATTARETGSEGSPAARSTGSAESPPS